MTNKLDWNYERYRTRDRLLEYDFNIYPMVPHSAGLSMIYPWENIAIQQLSKQIIEVARLNGYTGSEEDLWRKFSNGTIHQGTLDNFPIPGNEQDLYLDTETDILYYFKSVTSTVYTDVAARVGVAIVGYSKIEDSEEIVTYLYIPIKAMPIENLIFDCGDAAEYIG